MLSRKIWVTFSRHGIHRYPSAPNEVAYLQHPHRHLFQFKAAISVTHDDREIEFHMFQNFLMGLYDQNQLMLDHKSCEMIADDLLSRILLEYPNRDYVCVEVSEDGECGAVVEYSGRDTCNCKGPNL